MTDRPIIFSAPMVKALFASRKTQTRRMLKPQPFPIGGPFYRPHPQVSPREWHSISKTGRITNIQTVVFAIGDRLWLREAWKPHSLYAGLAPREMPIARIFYRADDRYAPSNTAWRSPIHMPRWASRLTLTVTEVRVERVQDLSEEDAIAEGVASAPGGWWSGAEGHAAPTARAAFAVLWNSLHGPDAWSANPWVAAGTFSVEQRNIDAERREAVVA